MKAIGQLLRGAREEKGITLQEISKETKIQERHLQALEEGDFSSFPGQVYLKGALRNYANAVGIDDSEIITMFEQSLKQENHTLDNKKKKNDNTGKTKKREKVVKDKEKIFYPRKKKTLSTGALVWIVLLVIIVTGSVWYGYRQSAGNNAETLRNNDFPAEENGVSEPRFDEEPQHEEVEIPEEPPVTPAIELVHQDRDEIRYLLKEVETKEILLTFQGPCWVRIEQDGDVLEETTYASEDSRQLGDAQRTIIRLGAPPNASIKVNELEIDDFSEATNPVNIVIEKET